MRKNAVLLLVTTLALSLLALVAPTAASADQAALSPNSWDPGLSATTPNASTVHAWGRRQSAGAWGTGPVNYISGATVSTLAAGSGTLGVTMSGTYCPGACAYGTGSGYKGFTQFWNDPSNYIAIGLIHDPGASPNGTTLMVEGAAGGRPVGGYWAGGGVTGASHYFAFAWGPAGLSVRIDNNVSLGPYPVSMTHPSISFLAAGRNTGDIPDVTFSGISFSSGSVTSSPLYIPAGNPYFSYSATITENGAGTGHSAYINAHDAYNNAISVGVQSDTGSPQSAGQPYYIWELVQGGRFTFAYLGPASHGPIAITLKWWTSGTAVFYQGSNPIASIPMGMNPRLFFNVEGDGRLNGDQVNSTFTNVAVSFPGVGAPNNTLNGAWNTSSFNFHGLRATNTNGYPQNGASFTVTGTVSGLAPGHDWDSDIVSGIGMIAQYWNGQ